MTSQGRRKHSTCLFRMRENCPFRRLRKSMCSDSRSALVSVGGQWSEASPQAGSPAENCSEGAVGGQTFSTAPLEESHPHEEFPAMDTDLEPATGSSRTESDAPGQSHFIHVNQQHQPSHSDTIMELDSGVDPETGERAQG